MPFIPPNPLGALSSPVTSLNERTRASESNRLTASGATATVTPYTTASTTLVVPSGWPAVPFLVGPAGMAVIFVQACGYVAGGVQYGFFVGISIDGGTIINVGSGLSSNVLPGGPGIGVYVLAGQTPGSTHTAKVAVSAGFAQQSTEFQAPTIVAKAF